MLIRAEDRPGYSPAIMWPENGAPPYPGEVDWRFGSTPNMVHKQVEKALPAPLIAQTPYTNAYTRDYDGALMVEITGLGCFVSESWAAHHGYLNAAVRSTSEALAPRKEARSVRKARAKSSRLNALTARHA